MAPRSFTHRTFVTRVRHPDAAAAYQAFCACGWSSANYPDMQAGEDVGIDHEIVADAADPTSMPPPNNSRGSFPLHPWNR